MREVEFRIAAKIEPDTELARKVRERSGARTHGPTLLILRPGFWLTMFAAIGVFTAVRAYQTDISVAEVHGKEVRGARVLVLIDDSGSMKNTETEVSLQLGRLAQAGIAIDLRNKIPGYAISLTDGYSLLPKLKKGISSNPSVDVVYVISDFSGGDDAVNDSAGYLELLRLLGARRIYWASVRAEPAPIYHHIARQTKGDVIRKN